MKRFPALRVLLCLAPLVIEANTSMHMRVVPLGSLDGPTLRAMSATACGPFFTFIPLDADGGGLVKMVLDAAQDDQRHTVLTNLHVKSIQVKFCESCDAPLFKPSGDESSLRGELTISREHWKLSPCLKSAKVSKR
jgi:hypothetical protein